jgi:hypothetical protein
MLRFPLVSSPNVCYYFLVIHATNNSWAALRFGVCRHLLRLGRHVLARVQHMLPQMLALIVVLVLGVLSPLSCVIHCFIQERIAERSALAFFLCGEHAVAVPEDADLLDRLSIVGSTTDEPLTPRAFYEMLSLPLLLFSVLVLLTVLIQPLPSTCVPFVGVPPTPPPRLSIA